MPQRERFWSTVCKSLFCPKDKRGFCNDIRSCSERMIYLWYDIHLRWGIYAWRMAGNGYYIMLAAGKYIMRYAHHIARAIYHEEAKGVFMAENKLLEMSFEFAVAIVNLVDGVTIPKSSYMTDQLARAGTSVGANIHEAQYAQSKKDFISKLEIALKESNETSYWLKLMYETKRIDVQTYQYTEKLCRNIRRLLIASCKTAKGM